MKLLDNTCLKNEKILYKKNKRPFPYGLVFSALVLLGLIILFITMKLYFVIIIPAVLLVIVWFNKNNKTRITHALENWQYLYITNLQIITKKSFFNKKFKVFNKDDIKELFIKGINYSKSEIKITFHNSKQTVKIKTKTSKALSIFNEHQHNSYYKYEPFIKKDELDGRHAPKYFKQKITVGSFSTKMHAYVLYAIIAFMMIPLVYVAIVKNPLYILSAIPFVGVGALILCFSASVASDAGKKTFKTVAIDESNLYVKSSSSNYKYKIYELSDLSSLCLYEYSNKKCNANLVFKNRKTIRMNKVNTKKMQEMFNGLPINIICDVEKRSPFFNVDEGADNLNSEIELNNQFLEIDSDDNNENLQSQKQKLNKFEHPFKAFQNKSNKLKEQKGKGVKTNNLSSGKDTISTQVKKRRFNAGKFGTVLCLSIFVLAGCFCVWFYTHVEKDTKNFVEIDAVLVGFEKKEKTYNPVFEYTVDGTSYQNKVKVGSSSFGLEVGKVYKILLNPQNPEEIQIPKENVGLLVVGGLFIIVGLFIIISQFVDDKASNKLGTIVIGGIFILMSIGFIYVTYYLNFAKNIMDVFVAAPPLSVVLLFLGIGIYLYYITIQECIMGIVKKIQHKNYLEFKNNYKKEIKYGK